VITTENHLYVMGRDMDNAGIEDEDVAIKLFSSSLTEEALDWFRGLPDNHLTSYDDFPTLSRTDGQQRKMVGHLGLS
jgi:hypothetical protein